MVDNKDPAAQVHEKGDSPGMEGGSENGDESHHKLEASGDIQPLQRSKSLGSSSSLNKSKGKKKARGKKRGKGKEDGAQTEQFPPVIVALKDDPLLEIGSRLSEINRRFESPLTHLRPLFRLQ